MKLPGGAPKRKARYLGFWALPSGNSADVFLGPDGLRCEWDTPPHAGWPAEDLEHWQAITFPAILRAVSDVTGQRVLGASL